MGQSTKPEEDSEDELGHITALEYEAMLRGEVHQLNSAGYAIDLLVNPDEVPANHESARINPLQDCTCHRAHKLGPISLT